MKLKFLGLGAMGFPMASRLASRQKIGYGVYDIDSSAVSRFIGLHPHTKSLISTNAEMEKSKDVVFLSLPGSKEVSETIEGPSSSIIKSLLPGSIVVNTSTCAPECSQECAAHLESRGIAFLDAPVTGEASIP